MICQFERGRKREREREEDVERDSNKDIRTTFNPNNFGGLGSIWPCNAKVREKKCPCLHNNNTALIKQISLIDTALVITKS